jgi:predicted small lipoprotein YifL
MKRVLCFIMAMLLLSALTAGCLKIPESAYNPDAGSSKTSGDNKGQSQNQSDTGKAADGGDRSEGPKGGIYKEPGSELGDFYSFVDDTVGVHERAMNSYETDDFYLSFVTADPMVLTTALLSLSMLDYIESGDNMREEGRLNGADAVRERNGDKITFSMKRVREEDGFDRVSKKGDVSVETGTLDMSSNTVTIEAKIERDGEVIERSICETVVLPDNTIIAQVLRKPIPPEDDRVANEGKAYFLRFNTEKFEIVTAKFEPDVNFTYRSIVGDASATPDSMSEGYTMVRRMTIIGDEVTAERYE